MFNPKVFAVVVTYKRPQILAQCLDAVLNLSTYKIKKLHIVVNSNDDETLQVLERFKNAYGDIISFSLYDNSGPAGGFHYGIKKFLYSKCDFVWLMDDDLIPESNCLENLLHTARTHPYIFPKVLKENGDKVNGFGWWGVLISMEIVKKVGLPLKDFFYWTEDTEYLQNRMIRKFKIFPYKCNAAVVTHLHIRKGERPNWYYYYTIRNTLYYRIRIFPLNFKGAGSLLKVFAGTFYRILFKEPQKLKKINLVILGVSHGVAGKLGKLSRIHKEN